MAQNSCYNMPSATQANDAPSADNSTHDDDYNDDARDEDYVEDDTQAPAAKSNRKSTKGRQLKRWGPDEDQLLLLFTEYICTTLGKPIPWDEVAEAMEPRDPSKGEVPMTGEAIKQHLTKIRDHRTAEGRRVPPKLNRGAKRSAAKLQSIAHPLLPEANRMYGSGAAKSRAKGAQAKAEDTSQPRKSTLLAEPTVSRRKNQQQKAKAGQKNIATEPKTAGTGAGTKRGATKQKGKQQSAPESTKEVDGGTNPTGTWQLRATEPKNYAETPTNDLEQTCIKDEDYSDDEPLAKKVKKAHDSAVKPKSRLLNDTVHRWNNRDPFSSPQKDEPQLGSHSNMKVSKGLPSAFIDTSLDISPGNSQNTAIGHSQAPYPTKLPSAGCSVQQGSESGQYPRPLPVATNHSEPSNYFGPQPSSMSYSTIMQNFGGANSSFLESPAYGTSSKSYSDPSYSNNGSFAASQTSVRNDSTSTSFSSNHDGGTMINFNPCQANDNFNAMSCSATGNHIGSGVGSNIVPPANNGQGGHSINLAPNDGGFASASTNLGLSNGNFAGLSNLAPTNNGYAIPFDSMIANDSCSNDLPSNSNSDRLSGLPLPLNDSSMALIAAYNNGIQDQAQDATSPAFSSDEPVFGTFNSAVSQTYSNSMGTGIQDQSQSATLPAFSPDELVFGNFNTAASQACDNGVGFGVPDQAQPATSPGFSSDEQVFGNFNTGVRQAHSGPDSVPRSFNAPADLLADDFDDFVNSGFLDDANDVSFTLPAGEGEEDI